MKLAKRATTLALSLAMACTFQASALDPLQLMLLYAASQAAQTATQTTIVSTGEAEQPPATDEGGSSSVAPTTPEEDADAPADSGLAGATLILEAAAMTPGDSLRATARVDGLAEPKICRAQWFLDGVALEHYRNEQFTLAPESASEFVYELIYQPQMHTSHLVGFYVTYVNPQTGEEERLSQTLPIVLQNHDEAYYSEHIERRISTTYTADTPDYLLWEKEYFVNQKNYVSQTDYLVWVNRATQRVNVFTGSAGAWQLDRTLPCATGLPRTQTPVGVTYVTAKQTGWYFSTYTCKNIVRFYPDSGYAFHSQPLYPNTDTAKETAMSTPASLGCVRLLVEDSAWLHQTVPLKTTVVIW